MVYEEVCLLGDIYEAARGVLRYEGVDKERYKKAYESMRDSVHRMNDFYLDPDNEKLEEKEV